MSIIGCIRQGDKAACGGVVLEGHPMCISMGRLMSYHGAAMGCRHSCHAIASNSITILPNGLPILLHGDVTSRGCPLISGLNGTHGVSNSNSPAEGEQDAPVSNTFLKDQHGEWQPTQYEDRFVLRSTSTGKPLPNTAYTVERDGGIEHGISDDQGRTHVAAQALHSELVHIYIEAEQ